MKPKSDEIEIDLFAKEKKVCAVRLLFYTNQESRLQRVKGGWQQIR